MSRKDFIMTGDNRKFKNWLIKKFQREGYDSYAKELEGYKIQLTEDPRTFAAVDAPNKTIILNYKMVEQESIMDPSFTADDRLSFLIRHELLHSLLRHHERTVAMIAESLGYDPQHIKKKQFIEILNIMSRPSILYRKYNGGKGIVVTNGAGDIHLSTSYIQVDNQLARKARALLMEDHPGWENDSFEEITDKLLEQEHKILKRYLPIVYGTLVDEKTFEIDHEDSPIFDTTTNIDTSDITGIDLPTSKILKNYLGDNYSEYWVKDSTTKRNAACVYSWGSVKAVDRSRYQANICPIIEVDNLDLYKAINEAGGKCTCLGYPAVVVSLHSVGGGQVLIQRAIDVQDKSFDYAGSEPDDFEDTKIYKTLETWLNNKLKA